MRINVLSPRTLADQHLRAEYNEIYSMMITYYRRSILERKTSFDESEIPTKYTLNKGHAKFFYNKMKYVQDRWYAIRKECNRRGFVTNLVELDYNTVKPEHMNSYDTTYEAKLINIERILSRIYMKIFKQNKNGFYTYERKHMTFLQFCTLIRENENIEDRDMFNIIKKIKGE